MKKTLFISTIVALAAFSCAKSDLEGQGVVPGQIQVSSTIASVQSKGLVDDPSSVLTGVAFVHAQVATASDPVSFAGLTAFSGNRTTSGAIAFQVGSVPMYDKVTGKISYLMGYHPAGTAVSDIVSWTPDGATDILVTNLWSAGKYTNPETEGMNFSHVLSRIEVKTAYASGSTPDAVSDTWGKIKGIAFKDAPKTISLSYVDNKVTAGTSKADFALLNGSAYTAGPFLEIPITSSSNVVASAMIPPTGLGTFTLIVTTDKHGDLMLPVTLSASKKIEAGMIYTATIEFNSQDKTVVSRVTNISPWKPILTDKRPVPLPVRGPVIEFGKAPHKVISGLPYGWISYNALHGENTVNPGSNGSYYTSYLLAYAGEPPYPRLEIDLDDIYPGTGTLDWRQLKGTDQDICKVRQGPQWRMPRLSEMQLMHLNATTLDATGNGYVPLKASKVYWSATENSADNAWVVYYKSNFLPSYASKSTNVNLVRCVRELPLIESVVLEYGQVPHSAVSNIPNKTYTSYRALYGENTGADPLLFTNGLYRSDITAAKAEFPYYKLEVAATDILDGNGLPLAMTWREAQRTGFDDNICALYRGPGWRLPRFTELYLITANLATMTQVGLQPLVSDKYYWSSTEVSADNAFGLIGTGMTYYSSAKTPEYNVRCVKESLRPAIGDYYYSDKSSSPTLQAGKTLLGIVYRVNPDGTGMMMEVTESAVLLGWSTVMVLTDTGHESGLANTDIIKGLDPTLAIYPPFKYCEDKNKGGVTLWYLPASKEMRALHAGISGLRWMDSGANPAKGEINDWGTSSMPNNAGYVAARTAFSAKMTAAGVGGAPFANEYWCSTGYTERAAYALIVNSGSTVTYLRSGPLRARCVRAF